MATPNNCFQSCPSWNSKILYFWIKSISFTRKSVGISLSSLSSNTSFNGTRKYYIFGSSSVITTLVSCILQIVVLLNPFTVFVFKEKKKKEEKNIPYLISFMKEKNATSICIISYNHYSSSNYVCPAWVNIEGGFP